MERIGKYEIISLLGQGGMGAVYKGRDAVIGREVAIKVIQERALNAPAIRERFYREARSAGRLSHENITVIYDVGDEDGTPFLVMEYLEGRDLREVLNARTRLPNEDKLSIALQVARGLHYAHEQGIVHRDIKPENIRVLPNGRAKIMDFGIARILNETQALTQTNLSLGTPRYMSPEQVMGESPDHRSDIFSYGVLLYELFTGDNPFVGEHVTTIIYKILHTEPEPLHIQPEGLAQELQSIVARCLAKDREARYQHFGEVIQALQALYPHDLTQGHTTPLQHEETVALATPTALDQTLMSPVGAAQHAPTEVHTRPAKAPARASVLDKMGSKTVRWAALAVVLAVGLGTGGYFAFRTTDPPPTTTPAAPADAAPSATLAAVDSVLAAADSLILADTLTDGALLPSPEEALPPGPDAGPAPSAEQRAADQERGAMDRARRRVAGQRNDEAVASRYQRAEEARRTGNRQYDAGNYAEATQSFRTARAAFEQMQTILAERSGEPEPDTNDDTTPPSTEPTEGGEAAIDRVHGTPGATGSNDQNAADAARTLMQAAKDAVPASLHQNAAFNSALDEENRGIKDYEAKNYELAAARFSRAEFLYKQTATLPAPETAVQRLAGLLKNSLEQKNASTLENVFLANWSTFFEFAQDIKATVNPGNVQVSSTRGMVDVRVVLSYKNNKNQAQRSDPITYTWMLKYDEGKEDWVIERVITQ